VKKKRREKEEFFKKFAGGFQFYSKAKAVARALPAGLMWGAQRWCL